MLRFPHAVPALAFLRATAFADDDCKLGPDSQPQEVPRGELRKAVFDQSKIFPGTLRFLWHDWPRD